VVGLVDVNVRVALVVAEHERPSPTYHAAHRRVRTDPWVRPESQNEPDRSLIAPARRPMRHRQIQMRLTIVSDAALLVAGSASINSVLLNYLRQS
jgi:hypothetical protein